MKGSGLKIGLKESVYTVTSVELCSRAAGKMTNKRDMVSKSGRTMLYTRVSTLEGRNMERVNSNGPTTPATRDSSWTTTSVAMVSINGEMAGSSKERYIF